MNTDMLKRITDYCLEKAPEEACGYIYNNEVYFVDNVSDDPVNTFKLSVEDCCKISDLDCILWHSHTNGMAIPSKEDMECQQVTGKEWLIFVFDKQLNNYYLKEYFSFGDDTKTPPLYGRTFKFGVTDCYSFIRDYYRQELGINLKNYPREYRAWYKGVADYENHFKDEGFIEVGRGLGGLEKNDVILFRLNSPVLNHGAVYLGNGLIGHHLEDKLSKTDAVERWGKFAEKVLRYAK